jgi:hypothetical protein
MTTQKKNIDKYCRVCKCLLTDENTSPSRIKNRSYICKKCWVKTTKEYRNKYVKENTVFSHGKLLYGKKREWKKECELCGKKRGEVKIFYHHYDDKNLKKGLYLCSWCHYFVERYEKGFLPKYIELKKKMLKEIGVQNS